MVLIGLIHGHIEYACSRNEICTATHIAYCRQYSRPRSSSSWCGPCIYREIRPQYVCSNSQGARTASSYRSLPKFLFFTDFLPHCWFLFFPLLSLHPRLSSPPPSSSPSLRGLVVHDGLRPVRCFPAPHFQADPGRCMVPTKRATYFGRSRPSYQRHPRVQGVPIRKLEPGAFRSCCGVAQPCRRGEGQKRCSPCSPRGMVSAVSSILLLA